MIISITNSIQNTHIFIGIFVLIVLATIRIRKTDGLSNSVSTELKGFAILAIIFAHIGYILVQDHSFLFPISILAGVGVDLFLFLSGYGLTMSAFKKNESILQFYKKRITKLFIPFWIVLFSFLVLDYFILHIVYAQDFILKAIFGIFTHANAFQDLNSPLWYFTLILLYYLLFPLLFFKKYPWISAILISLTTYCISLYLIPLQNVAALYKVHTLAFPLGILLASFVQKDSYIKKTFGSLTVWYKKFEKILYPIIFCLLVFIIGYTALYSGVGKGIRLEQTYSLITMFAVVLFFVFKKFEFRLLSLFGLYSYEIYLFHWPLMYRYDLFYKYVPGWLATILYLVLFIGLAVVLERLTKILSMNKNKPRQN